MAHNIARFESMSKDIRLSDIIEILEKLLGKATTRKQQRILILLKREEFRFVSTTQTVKVLAAELACAESTVWDSLSVLKELGFVICNGRIELTRIGIICADMLGEKNGHEK